MPKGPSGQKRHALIRTVLPILDMRQRVEANRMAQAKLEREISALKSGAVLVDAQKRLIDLKNRPHRTQR